MLRTLAFVVFAAGCGGAKQTSTAAASNFKGAAKVPDDANSAQFAAALLALKISNFRPSDAPGATFIYTSLQFRPDNTWAAEGYVEAGDERMECAEAGTWTMDPADSADTATMDWILDRTDCAGRENGQEIRVKLVLKGGGIESAAFR